MRFSAITSKKKKKNPERFGKELKKNKKEFLLGLDRICNQLSSTSYKTTNLNALNSFAHLLYIKKILCWM